MTPEQSDLESIVSSLSPKPSQASEAIDTIILRAYRTDVERLISEGYTGRLDEIVWPAVTLSSNPLVRELAHHHRESLEWFVGLIAHAYCDVISDNARDALTGALSRARFNHDVSSLESYSLLLVDIDRFKEINDTYGHEVGDRVLKEIVATTQNAIRDQDRVYRYGGEEFVIVLPQTREDEAYPVAQRVRETINETRQIGLSDADAYRSVSIGVATYRKGERPDAVLKRADQGLYRAKESRDTIIAIE